MPTLDLPPDPLLEVWPRSGRIAILDLEYTAWNGSAARQWAEPWEWREIVQIGCVIADASNGFAIADAFEVMVQPNRNPELSEYFIALTGISQSQLEEHGVALPEALFGLDEFTKNAECIVFNGIDGEVLRENCAFHGVTAPWPMERMLDFRPLLSRTLDLPAHQLVSSDLPALAGVAIAGRAHSALHDCHAIAAAFAVWRSADRL